MIRNNLCFLKISFPYSLIVVLLMPLRATAPPKRQPPPFSDPSEESLEYKMSSRFSGNVQSSSSRPQHVQSSPGILKKENTEKIEFYSERKTINNAKVNSGLILKLENFSLEKEKVFHVSVPVERFKVLGVRPLKEKLIDCLMTYIGKDFPDINENILSNKKHSWNVVFFQSFFSGLIYGAIFSKDKSNHSTPVKSSLCANFSQEYDKQFKTHAFRDLDVAVELYPTIPPQEEVPEKQIPFKQKQTEYSANILKNDAIIEEDDSSCENNIPDPPVFKLKVQQCPVHAQKDGELDIESPVPDQMPSEIVKSNQSEKQMNLAEIRSSGINNVLDINSQKKIEKNNKLTFIASSPLLIGKWLGTPPGYELAPFSPTYDIIESVIHCDLQEIMPKVCCGLLCCPSWERSLRQKKNARTIRAQEQKVDLILIGTERILPCLVN